MTHVGMVRTENQDHYGYLEPDSEAELASKGRLLVVCDGMGGHNGGIIASHTTVDSVLETFSREPPGDPAHLLSTALEQANHTVREKGAADPALRNMGTTCVAAVARGGEVTVAHVGDSRAYVIRNGEASQVTRDHTYLNDLIDIGLMTREAARTHQHRNVITRCVGMGDVLQADVRVLEVRPGDALLLCSDGLYNHVDDSEIQSVASAGGAQDACRELVELANRRGGEDNVTVAILRIREIPERQGAGTAVKGADAAPDAGRSPGAEPREPAVDDDTPVVENPGRPCGIAGGTRPLRGFPAGPQALVPVVLRVTARRRRASP